MGTQVTVRSELAVVEAVLMWPFCLTLVALVVATTASPWAVPLAIAVVVVLLWLPLAWSMRRVVVGAEAITEVRLWPFQRTWAVGGIEALRLASWDVGVIGLPATRVEMDVAGESVWFPTLQAGALTSASRRRALERVERLASGTGAPWAEATL